MSNTTYKLPEIRYCDNAKDFMGLDVIDNKLVLYAHSSLSFCTEYYTKRKQIIMFLKSVSLARKISNEYVKEVGGKSDEIWPIDSYLWIINDYVSNGFYYNRSRVHTRDNSGRIDWKKTLKTTPIVSKRNIVYKDLIASKLSPVNDEIALIYRYCLKTAISRLGWAYDANFEVEARPTKSKHEMINIIHNEISSTFEDTKRLRFKHLLIILNGSSNDTDNNGKTLYGTHNYEYAFEYMIDCYFKGYIGEAKKMLNPRAKWTLYKTNEISNVHSGRLDTIFCNNEKLYIIDAKMYKFGHTHNSQDLPKMESIQKQVAYGDSVKVKNEPQFKVRNSFIIPFDKAKFSGTEIEYIIDDKFAYLGKATTDWRKEINEEHDTIFTFLIDMMYLLENYTNKNIYKIPYCELIESKLTYD